MSPVKLAKVKSRSTTLELLGRSAAPALFWSTYCWLMKMGNVTFDSLILDQETLLTRPWPPTQDLNRAAYRPPAKEMRSKWMLETEAGFAAFLPREPMERPG